MKTKSFSISSKKSTIEKKAGVFLTNGNFVITWKDGDKSGVYARMFDANQNTIKVGGQNEFLVNTYTRNVQYSSTIAALKSGGFVIAWESYGQDNDGKGIYAQIFDAKGNKLCKTKNDDKNVEQCEQDGINAADLLIGADDYTQYQVDQYSPVGSSRTQ